MPALKDDLDPFEEAWKLTPSCDEYAALILAYAKAKPRTPPVGAAAYWQAQRALRDVQEKVRRWLDGVGANAPPRPRAYFRKVSADIATICQTMEQPGR